MKLSVVVVVQGGETGFLDRALKSIHFDLTLAVNDFEMIVVDNRTGDVASEIIDAFAQKYKDVKVIHRSTSLKPHNCAEEAYETAKGDLKNYIVTREWGEMNGWELENGVMVETNPKEYEYRFGIDKILGIVNAKALNEVCSPEYIAREAWLKKETEALIMQEKSGVLRMRPKTMGCLSEPWKL